MKRNHFAVTAGLASLVMGLTGIGHSQVVINEIWNGSGADEYVELFNTTASPVNLAGWTLVRRTNSGEEDLLIHTFSGTIPANGYWLVGGNGTGQTINEEYNGTSLIATSGQSIALKNGATLIDGVGFGTEGFGVGAGFYAEPSGSPRSHNLTTGSGVERSPNGTDTNVSTADWAVTALGDKTPGIDNDTAPAGATDVADIAAARALASGTEVRITGTVTVTAPTGFSVGRNQFTIQDASGSDGQSAILIDDNPNVAGKTVAPGDTFENVQGTLSLFNGLLQIVLSEPLGTAGSGTVPTPLALTAGTLIDDIESELVVIEDADIAETGTWGNAGPPPASVNYTLTQPTDLSISLIRVGSTSPLIGASIPGGAFAVTGIAGDFNGTGQIMPRGAEDIESPSAVSDWTLY